MDSARRAERHDESMTSRMYRGLVACAECRRMKHKCDKKVPCGSCVRRGCSGICPTGKLASRQESRTILVGTSSRGGVQDEIARLRERNSQLEDALAFAHSHISKEVHPLLVESSDKQPQNNPEVDKVIEDLGTLALGEVGEVQYFGPSAATETLYQAVSATDESTLTPIPLQRVLDSTLENLSPQMTHGSTLDMEAFVSSVLADLPERSRAQSLCDIFYRNFTIYTVPIQREELIQAHFCPLYKYLKDSKENPSLPFSSTAFRPHRCAVTFLALAHGEWLDLDKEDYWEDADRYFQIGIWCLSMQSIFHSPEVASVQALFLIASYIELRGAPSTATLSPSWTILALAGKIAQGLGLHRDCSQWHFDEVTIQRRRWLYWELASRELFHSLGTGRPPSIRQNYVDTEPPDDVGQTDAHGQPLQGFFRWKHEALRDFHHDVVESLLAAPAPNYEAIIELDRKVRAKEIPAHLNRILNDNEGGVDAREFMHSFLLGVVRSMLLLSIHRSYLTKALQDPSGNPLKSRYAPSFLASYRAASWVVKSFHATQKRFPIILSRLWHPWTNVFTAAMVLGSIAINAPSSLVGNSPLEELRIASSMFEDAAARTISHRTKNGAKVVQKLLTRAEEAHARVSTGDASVVQSSFAIPPTNYGDDELAIFGGQTRTLPMKSGRKPLKSQPATSSSDSSSSGSPSDYAHWEDVHQSLIDFLQDAPVTQVASSTSFQDMEEAFGALLPPPFQDSGSAPLQLDSWVYTPLPITQNQYNFGNPGDISTSGLHISEAFENYVGSNAQLGPMAPIHETGIVDPWDDFVKRSFPS
ncbi:hypothetical protein DL96DRAFT_845099 [Flagelloscypha sp. PMI_526]|nr:hypothetical protein DL96DRAFT_845099 [Flagelloscypha sp. PMI_526]